MHNKWEWEQPISKEIFNMKYNIHDQESIEDIFQEISNEISSCEKSNIRNKTKEDFYDQLITGKFIPAGRILANARPNSKMKNYNNCFTIQIEDSMEGIYNALKEDAMIGKMGGGVGFNISGLRPKNASISKGGESSGPLSFTQIFDASAKTIHTGGGRRGAHIAIMNIDHPDIEEFITIKQGDKNKALTQFNISVGITDDFIQAYKDDADWNLKFKGKVYKTIKARDLYDKIVKNAYMNNEPGIFNLDHVNKESNAWYLYNIEQVNPCGEQPLPPYGVCDLGAINFTRFVKNAFTDQAEILWDDLKESIHMAVRFLDNVLSATEYPLEKIKDRSLNERRIGLGFTGFANMLTKLKIKYGSKESIDLIHELGSFLRDESYRESVELAKEKGEFASLDRAKFIESGFCKRLPENIKQDILSYGIRNIALLTVAPTGTTSLSVGQNCSSGIEPIFSLSYNRKYRTGNGDETSQQTVYDQSWLEYLNFAATPEQAKEALLGHEVTVPIPDYFTTTMSVDIRQSIDVQATWQQYIDASISKTANLPSNMTYDEYKDLFLYAYDKGLKGFTSFNPSGNLKGILEYNEPKVKSDEKVEYIERHMAPKRPDELPCDIHEISVNGKKWMVLVGKLSGSLYEIFVDENEKGLIDVNNHKEGVIRKNAKSKYSLVIKNGQEKVIVDNLAETMDATYGVMARMTSMALRHGTPLQFIVDQMSKSKHFMGFERAVSRVLKKYIKDGEKVMTGDVCPECGESLIFQDGCTTCRSCSWSKCI